MKIPATPANEAQRLRALDAYGVIDTAAQPVYDNIAKMAAMLLGTPTALVSLITRDRQWFKGRYGVDLQELPRDISFCAHVVADDAPLVVPDASQDERFADNPLVAGAPEVRFYAGVPLRGPSGLVFGTLCVIDTTPREPPTAWQLEMLELLSQQVIGFLEKRHARLELSELIESLSEGVMVHDDKGEVILANLAAANLIGVAPREVGDRKLFERAFTYVREDGSPYRTEDLPAAVALRTGISVRDAILGLPRPDGTTVWMTVNSTPRTNATGAREVVSTFHDITTMRDVSERLATQARLATVGTLAAGVGHEINNPLVYVIGNVDFALEELKEIGGPSPSSRLQEVLSALVESREGAERIRRIVRGLRSLAGGGVSLGPVDVRAAIDTAVSMSAHELRAKATLSVEASAERVVIGDESQLAQALVSLIVNAAQAFPTANPAANAITISTQPAAGGRLSIRVSDNGPGVLGDLRPRIFDPFFTTKAAGVGTGLGLTMSRSVIESIGGELVYEPGESGRGARFSILLPTALEHVSHVTPVETVKRGRVLVIDGDESAMGFMRRVLARSSEVTMVRDAGDALQLLSAAGEPFDLVLCALAMPGASVPDLFRAVRIGAPRIAARFVFTTTGLETAEATAFLSGVANERLDKPFGVQPLMDLMRRYILTATDAAEPDHALDRPRVGLHPLG